MRVPVALYTHQILVCLAFLTSAILVSMELNIIMYDFGKYFSNN